MTWYQTSSDTSEFWGKEVGMVCENTSRHPRLWYPKPLILDQENQGPDGELELKGKARL